MFLMVSKCIFPLYLSKVELLHVQIKENSITTTNHLLTVLSAGFFQISHQRPGSAAKHGNAVLTRVERNLLHFAKYSVHVRTTPVEIVLQLFLRVGHLLGAVNITLHDGGQLASAALALPTTVADVLGGSSK